MKRTLVKGIVVTAAAVTLPLTAATAAMASTHEATHSGTVAAEKTAASSSARLTAGETLWAGQSRTSQNGKYRTVMQHDGNFVLYKKLRNNKQQALWSTRTTGTGANRIVMQLDGNLVVYKGQKEAVWATGTNPQTFNTPSAGAWLAVQNDSNVVIYSAAAHGNKPLWSRHMFIELLPSGFTLTPGKVVKSRDGRFEFVMQRDSNLVLYDKKNNNRPMWSTNTHGKGASRVEMQRDGNLVMYKGKKAIWASNTARHPGARLIVQTDGNVVIYSKVPAGQKPAALWSTRTHV